MSEAPAKRYTIKAHLIGPWKWFVWDSAKRTEVGFHEDWEDATKQAARLNKADIYLDD